MAMQTIQGAEAICRHEDENHTHWEWWRGQIKERRTLMTLGSCYTSLICYLSTLASEKHKLLLLIAKDGLLLGESLVEASKAGTWLVATVLYGSLKLESPPTSMLLWNDPLFGSFKYKPHCLLPLVHPQLLPGRPPIGHPEVWFDGFLDTPDSWNPAPQKNPTEGPRNLPG